MNYRSIFQQAMNYDAVDRMPVIHWAGWPETCERWYGEGLPKQADEHDFLGAVPFFSRIEADLQIYPSFPEETLEVTPEYRIFRDASGVTLQDWTHRSCIPHYIDHSLKSAADWPRFKERLRPHVDRIPTHIENDIVGARDSGLPIAVRTASLMGWIRNWMGVENMCYLMFDAPDVYADMVNTLAELTCWSLDLTLPIARDLGVVPDMGFGWEDICGKSGPLVSPDIFDRCVAPGYRKIADKLESYGVNLLGLDSDGMIESLVPSWMAAGVNVFFPVEPGTWGGTPERLRQRFGKGMLMIGGYDKFALERDFAAIDAEIEAHIPLMREGGYILMPDHLITPDTPLENYRYYLERIRHLRF